MPPRQWEPLVAEFSDVMKLVHLAMRRDTTDITSIANELFKEKRQAYEDGLTAQAANAGCAGRKGVMPNDKLTMAHDESNSEAAGIANTYNYDLAVAIRHIRTETPSANRHVYAKRLLEWEATRDEWKSQQIALWNQTKWTNIAFQDFLAHNPQLNNGYAILQPKRTVCKICQYWASRGKVPLAEASRIEFPAHINCPHYWETHYKGKVNCEELWMGADVKQWWEDIEAGKELGEKGGPGSGNYGHSGRPGLVGGSGGNAIAPMGYTARQKDHLLTDMVWDDQTTNGEFARQEIGKYMDTIPDSISKFSGMRHLIVSDNVEDVYPWLQKTMPEELGAIPADAEVRGVYDRSTGTAIVSLYSWEYAEGYVGGNFYHEYAHSLEPLITSDGWERAWGEWDYSQDEGFAEAFSEYMVAKSSTDPGDMEWYQEYRPLSFEFFESLGGAK